MRRINLFLSLVTFIGILLIITMDATAQTLHAIVACNTTDRKIGSEMALDMKNVRNMLQTIASALECEYDEYALDGTKCTKANITDLINKMDVESDDIILFYYGGHGSHANNNSDDPWPQMCMNTNIQSLYFPVKSLDKMIAARKPRLQIMIMDCCNQEQDGVTIKPLFGAKGSEATIFSNYNPAVLKKLFFKEKGNVKITSSKLGQLSWSRPNGSIFTNNMLEVLDEVGRGKMTDPSWEKICKVAQQRTSIIHDLPDGARQEPFYEISDGGPVPVPVPTPITIRTSSNQSLYKALQTLLDHDQSKDQRLSNITFVKNKFFTSDAHIVTVGKNGTSKIMYEDVDAFLRRLALSDNIKQINVLEGNDQAKNSLITVHEVRY